VATSALQVVGVVGGIVAAGQASANLVDSVGGLGISSSSVVNTDNNSITNSYNQDSTHAPTVVTQPAPLVITQPAPLVVVP
jgi:hypothetical protein